MNITISQEQGSAAVAVLQLAGHLDGQTYQDLIAKTREAFESGARNILLDLAELTYISSAGLASLHTIALMLRGEALPDVNQQGLDMLKSMDHVRDGGTQKHVKLLNPRPEVVSVLDLVGFTDFFETFTDKQKALESF